MQVQLRYKDHVAIMHLSAAIPGGGGGGGYPGDIRGHGAGFVDFCCQFLAWDGGIGSLLHFVARTPGKDTRDL